MLVRYICATTLTNIHHRILKVVYRFEHNKIRKKFRYTAHNNLNTDKISITLLQFSPVLCYCSVRIDSFFVACEYIKIDVKRGHFSSFPFQAC